MTASDEMEQFLREGLKRYPGARETVETFEREMQERLLRALEGKEDWRNFKPMRGDRGRGKALSSDVWSDSDGFAIWAKQESAVEDGGSIELGLWWRSPRAKEGVLAYCNYMDASGRRESAQLAAPKSGVVCQPIDGSKSRIYALLERTETGIADILALLLDELDRSMASRDASAAGNTSG